MMIFFFCRIRSLLSVDISQNIFYISLCFREQTESFIAVRGQNEDLFTGRVSLIQVNKYFAENS